MLSSRAVHFATISLALAIPSAGLVPASSSRATPAAAETLRYARYPHIANNGQITFSYMDDIWVAEPGGTNPRRVTNNVARDINPRFSPDGAWIAFSSNRHGSYDVRP